MTTIPADWTKTELSLELATHAEPLATFGGFTFWEHPLHGDEGYILATVTAEGYDSAVYSTESLELPDPLDFQPEA